MVSGGPERVNRLARERPQCKIRWEALKYGDAMGNDVPLGGDPVDRRNLPGGKR